MMKQIARLAAVVALSSLMLVYIAGCPPTSNTGDGNDNTGGTDNTSNGGTGGTGGSTGGGGGTGGTGGSTGGGGGTGGGTGGGGTGTGGTGGSGGTSSLLSSKEADAVAGALVALEAMTQSVETSESVSDAGSLDTSSPQRQPVTVGEFTFGDCPSVTLALDSTTTGTLSVDFIDNCKVLGSDEFECSGAATGEIDRAAKTMTLVFDDVKCNNRKLNGSIDVIYELHTDYVVFDGAWDLRHNSSGDIVETSGEGTATYDRDNNTTTLDGFLATVTGELGDFDLEINDLEVSFLNNGNYIPSKGTIILTNDEVGEITITFDADSPSTGEVSVSIDGGTSFTVNLLAL